MKIAYESEKVEPESARYDVTDGIGFGHVPAL